MKRIFLIGYMGSGKTTLGKAFARAMQLQFIDLDWYIVFIKQYRSCLLNVERTASVR